MARIREREQRQPPPKRRIEHEKVVDLLACGDPRTWDHREILYTACGTRVCDKHAFFEHMCRIRAHRFPGHIPDP